MTLQDKSATCNGALALIRATREARIEPPLRKLVVFILASYADPNGASIRPSLKTVAAHTGTDPRSVRRHVRALEVDGVLVQTSPARQHHPAEYRLVLDALRADTRVHPDGPRADSDVARADSGDIQGGLTSPPTCTDLSQPEDTTARPAARHDGRFDLEAFRAVYPKRGGAQPWSRAVKTANARIRQGEPFNAMIEGAKRYAAHCETAGKTGTQFVMQAATFLGADRHYLEPWAQPTDEAEPSRELHATAYANEAAVRRFREGRKARGTE